jgi:2,5-diketo-D-gluconate reductase A
MLARVCRSLVKRSFGETSDKMGLDYLDLFLMHWQLPTLYDGDFVSTWRAMTELLEGGQVRSIGVSNFQPAHLERIVSETGVTPIVNQIEIHPGLNNTAAVDASKRQGIVVEAWSHLGQGKILDDPALADIAAAHDKTFAQIILRWHIQLGHVIFPKSMSRQRMEEDLGIFDFELRSEEIVSLDLLDKGEEGRIGSNPDVFAWVP